MSSDKMELTEQLKKRLFDLISWQVDLIGHVPADLEKLLDGEEFRIGGTGRKAEAEAAQAAAESAEIAALARRINRHYDQAFYSQDGITMMLSGGSDYRNIGYWDDSTTNLNQACERLQDALLDFIPEKKGRILDVACGMGASTRRLLNHYPADNIWAINISEKQIESTRNNAPGCHASVMNAVEMTFEEGFFDDVLCIEAAFHFQTRRKFLEDALRILKPGGRLVLSDVLLTSAERLRQYSEFPGPENHLGSVEEYRRLLSDTGFEDIVIQDVSKEVWGRHFQYVVGRIHEEFHERRLNLVQLTRILWTYYHLNAITGLCLFVSAQKRA
jgi:cyclopropane fatty-acyl-phospholipid synthase-like methyltransferase